MSSKTSVCRSKMSIFLGIPFNRLLFLSSTSSVTDYPSGREMDRESSLPGTRASLPSTLPFTFKHPMAPLRKLRSLFRKTCILPPTLTLFYLAPPAFSFGFLLRTKTANVAAHVPPHAETATQLISPAVLHISGFSVIQLSLFPAPWSPPLTRT